MNINFTQKRIKTFPKLSFSYIWKAGAIVAITVAIAEGYWIYHTHSTQINNISLPKTTEKNENMQFVASFSKKMSNNIHHSDTVIDKPKLLIDNVIVDSLSKNTENVVAIEETTINAPYQLKSRQVSQVKEQLTAWLKQNMAVVNDIRKVMYRIEGAKRKSKNFQDSLEVIHTPLNIIEDSIVLWKVRANSASLEALDSQSKKSLYILDKQELEWQKELGAAKERSTYWQSILHKYNEKLNLYKGK